MCAGDAIAMEYIEVQFCGVFMLLDKHKYVEIILSQMEKKYNEVSFAQLHEIRMNSSCRYKKDIVEKNIHYPMHVLDEVMENINMWVKKLPVNHDPKTWITHSPNVCLAQRCVTFEKNEYKRAFINFENMIEDGTINDRKVADSKYVEPKKHTEKQRVFEFIGKILDTEKTSTRLLDEQSFFETVLLLETKLKKKEQTQKEPSPFEDQDLNEIFDIKRLFNKCSFISLKC